MKKEKKWMLIASDASENQLKSGSKIKKKKTKNEKEEKRINRKREMHLKMKI